ncbi:hypothetical protein [Micromonospora chokoriensis]|uniref:Uncharacterized protein n=1 Tax=Micromonospora chokoriensis TaxID=356851 RepID=A0A1C4VNV3_9ACTN|nr:hypothetical protein [Micromonospora chokoriensis]SCE85618.1 hypothetical protein GA0070612_1641 [Micromonospora chokoriensis]
MRATSTTGVTVALLVALLAGCTSIDRNGTAGDPPPETPAPTATVPATGTPTPGVTPTVAPTVGAAAQVTLRMSGGFAGRGDSITVEPDGRWTMVDRAGSRRSGTLTPADLGTLTNLAADPRLAAEAGPPPTSTSCSDVFHYRLTVGGNESGYADCPADASPPPATQAVVKLLLRATGTYTR